ERAADLRRRGRARSELFSAARTAAQTLELFARVARERPARRVRADNEFITVEGVYDDGWMGRESVLGLAGWALASVEIEGQLDGIPALLPQELVVHVDGRPAHVVSLTTAGPFSVSVPLSSDGALRELREMSLVPKRTFCPLEHGL